MQVFRRKTKEKRPIFNAQGIFGGFFWGSGLCVFFVEDEVFESFSALSVVVEHVVACTGWAEEYYVAGLGYIGGDGDGVDH